jgi:hypothetical protein
MMTEYSLYIIQANEEAAKLLKDDPNIFSYD